MGGNIVARFHSNVQDEAADHRLTGPAIDDQMWTHVAAVLDTANDNFSLYVNGELQSQTTTSTESFDDKPLSFHVT